MIHLFWVGLVAVLEFGALSWLALRFAQGMFRWKLGNVDQVFIPLVAMVISMFMFGPYLSSWPDAFVPVSALYTTSLIDPVIALFGLIGAGIAGYGALKVLVSFGKIANRLGDAVTNAADRIRGWFDGSRKASRKTVAKEETPAVTSQVCDWGSARRRFDDLQRACQSLRNQLKEGTAYNQLGDISIELEKIRAAIEADSRKQSALPVLVSDYLGPTEQGLRLYELLLKSNVNSAQTAVKEVEEKTLALIHAKMVALHDQIYVSDIAQLSTVASALEVARPVQVKLEAPAELGA